MLNVDLEDREFAPRCLELKLDEDLYGETVFNLAFPKQTAKRIADSVAELKDEDFPEHQVARYRTAIKTSTADTKLHSIAQQLATLTGNIKLYSVVEHLPAE